MIELDKLYEKARDEYIISKKIERFLEKYPQKNNLTLKVLAHGNTFIIDIKNAKFTQCNVERTE